jgi:hypothetical protein
MFDATYFRTTLKRDVEATGGEPVVEVILLSGHVHRVRAVIDVGEGRVTFEAYQMKGEAAHHRPRYGDGAAASDELFRAIVSYESIAAVLIDGSPSYVKARPGF